MTDAYRTSAFQCPTCEQVALREFHGRLVCDECQGMQLSADDFADSIREIDGSKDELAFQDRDVTKRACPQCSQPMTACALALGSHAIEGDLIRCKSHGVWIPRDVMTAAYARASRRGGFRGLGATASAQPFRTGGVVGGDAGSFIGNMPSAHSGMSAAMAGIAKAFGGGGSASSGLAISQWQHQRPRAHTLFVSAHKDLTLACPACRVALEYQGDRWACSKCQGLFIESEALVAMVREMALTPWELPRSAGKPGERACPICKTPMTVELLEGVTTDHCDMHGVWFDEHELQQALHHSSPPPPGVVAWLKRLFGRG